MRRHLVLVLASLAVLAACADGGTDGATGSATTEPTRTTEDPAAGGGVSQADNDVQVTVDRGDGTPPVVWTLTCVGEAEGSHPEPEAACAHLAGLEDPFAPLPEDIVCTEQYGGPQTAHVIGRWDGDPVDLQLSRTNGCEISQWDSLGPFLPIPVG